MEIDLKQIRELLAVVSATDISELTIEFGDQRITVKKAQGGGQTVVSEVPAALQAAYATAPKAQAPAMSFEPKPEPVRTAPPPPAEEPALSNAVPITSPMVGTFYSSPSPTAAPFVKVGDHIAIGQTVCIIEAMKLMNDMPAEVSGKIVKVCVDNGTTVEYGQQLFLVDPKG